MRLPATRDEKGHIEGVVSMFNRHAPKLYESFHRLNDLCFSGQLPVLPIIVVPTFPYGRCIGQMKHGRVPHVWVKESCLEDGSFEGVVLHEMLHAYLFLSEESSKHNHTPWCREIERLSPVYLGVEVKAQPVNPRRVNGKVVRLAHEGYLTRDEIRSWPQSVLPATTRNRRAR